MDIFNKGLKFVSRLKVFYNRAGFYINLINLFMLLSSFLILNRITYSIWIVMPLMALIVLGIGFFDYKFILLKETAYSNLQNDIKIKLNIMDKKLNEILKK